MAAPDFVPLDPARRLRSYSSPPRRPGAWIADRPGELIAAIDHIRDRPPIAPVFVDVDGTAAILSRLVWALARTGRFDDAWREAETLLAERPDGLAHWEALARAGVAALSAGDARVAVHSRALGSLPDHLF